MTEKMNIGVITLDSLRFDVAKAALSDGMTPNFASLFEEVGIDSWKKVYSQATFTLPSHLTMFHAGFFPEDRNCGEPGYDRAVSCPFRVKTGSGRPNGLYVVPKAPNVVKGFESLGYRTVGIGAVGWFNTDRPTADHWHSYFQEFYWKSDFHENNPDALECQIELAKTLKLSAGEDPLFFFLNCSSTAPTSRAISVGMVFWIGCWLIARYASSGRRLI